MKIFETDVVYDTPIAHTLNYLHRKYPNPFATHVHTVDTLSREVDPETGIIRSERIIGVQQGAPKWITKLFSLPPVAYVREVVFVNPPGTGKGTASNPNPNEDEDGTHPHPTSTSMSVNLSLAQYVSCLELITYKPHSENQTLFQQKATIVSGFPTSLIARRVEQASIDRFKSNAGVGKKGFDWVLAGGQVVGRGYWTDGSGLKAIPPK